MFNLLLDAAVIAPPTLELFKSFNVELIKVRVPLLTLANPPPLLPPLTNVKLIKLVSAPILNIWLLFPSKMMLPVSLALMVISYVLMIPFTMYVPGIP